MSGFVNTPGGSRTHDLRLRRPTLYPTELLAHTVSVFMCYFPVLRPAIFQRNKIINTLYRKCKLHKLRWLKQIQKVYKTVASLLQKPCIIFRRSRPMNPTASVFLGACSEVKRATLSKSSSIGMEDALSFSVGTVIFTQNYWKSTTGSCP
jgi:hypothetical protein